ncbi:glycosyltransferase involved in cell wall biosynthesis [Catalinimonas alkaloidigena]|uniref:glycosyltransferase family 4 protein n=1 Tax=Catalinimonas alkaloidigena TaxID=1075417 RepID=UPI002404AA6B|nr:glycosyltransferase family 4 protein [Catalinimonas alkaloidigena]MDF9795223.1 glycosyltransferase involved in cell wall biosynthesis [Catalinimonas alkaloidigena]
MVNEKDKPVVLVIENSIDTTGAFKAILNYAIYARASYEFIFVLPRKSSLIQRVKKERFRVETLPFLEIRKHPIHIFLYLPLLIMNAIRLKRLVHRYQVNLVHVNDFYNLVAVVVKMLGGHFALLTHVRFMPDRFPWLLVKIWISLNLKYSERIICVSEAVRKCLKDHPKIHVIYDGLSNTISKRVKSKKDDGLIKLLYLAHYIPGKGQDFALQAFFKAYQQNPKLRLRFVGGDMGKKKNQLYKEYLKTQSIVLEIEQVVTFAGPATNIEHEFAKADIALNFSESESFSFTCLEALLNAVPLVASDSGGPSELFEAGKSGVLVSNRNVDEMTNAILYLTKDNNLRKTYAQEGFQYVSHKFAKSNTLEVLKEAYNQILP